MEDVDAIVFRELTSADFFNINKPRDATEGGGGQSYIDVPTNDVSIEEWDDFFSNISPVETHSGPRWDVEAHNLGVGDTQEVSIGQRRETTVNIRRQKLASRESNRLRAWHPEYTGFPTPDDPYRRQNIYGLTVYIARLTNGEYWAGWFHRTEPGKDWPINADLNKFFEEKSGIIENPANVVFDTADDEWPFRIQEAEEESSEAETEGDKGERDGDGEDVETETATSEGRGYEQSDEEDDVEEMFERDELIDATTSEEKKAEIREVRRRNQKVVRQLKDLYDGKCQISGEKYTFEKEDGTLYSEAHHLIPLGEGGSDSAYNIIIVSPLIHRMLHYADVSEINISEIDDNNLDISVNDEEYTITWHPRHAELVEDAAD